MNNMLLISIIILINLFVAKRLKYIGLRYSAYPTLSDIIYSISLSICIYLLIALNLNLIAFLTIICLNLLLFFDMALFKVYSINIDASAIKLFLQDYKSYLSQSTDDTLIRYIKLRNYHLFPIFTSLIFIPFCYHISYDYMIITLYLIYIIITISKVKLKMINIFILISIYLILIYFFQYHIEYNYNINTIYDYLLFIPILFIISKFLSNIQYKFFTTKCKISDFLGLSTLNFKKPINLYDKHKEITELKYNVQYKSDIKYPNSNVIIVTLESLNKDIYDKINFDLFNHKIISNHHFAISSNTYESLFSIYNGQYKNKLDFPFLKILKSKNFKNVFFTPQDLTFEKTNKLLKQSGFDELIYSSKKDSWGENDNDFYNNMYHKLRTILTKNQQTNNKFLLHILSSQTHIPYTVKNTKYYTNSKDKYIDSLTESINALKILFNNLNNDGFLDNTIVIFTGDHGESFGELNYNAHSTSISKEQIEIPFFITHKKLTKDIKINFSTHFDIMPTILDLLDINSNLSFMGQSLLFNNSQAFISYSKTKINNIPTCFGYITKDSKIFIDLMYERIWICKLDDTIIKTLKGNEKKQILYSLYIALKKRSLI